MPKDKSSNPERIKVLRSKNAGPYALTFDVVFRDPADFRKVVSNMGKEDVARTYRVTAESVISTESIESLSAFKVSIVRPRPAGHPGDSDCYGMNQEEPLALLVWSILERA